MDSGENWRLDCFADCFATLAMTNKSNAVIARSQRRRSNPVIRLAVSVDCFVATLAMTAREWVGKLSHGFGAAYGVTEREGVLVDEISEHVVRIKSV